MKNNCPSYYATNYETGMIEVFGPTYRYSGEILTKPEIIYINDHHYNEEDQCFEVEKLLENSTCDPMLHTLLFDHINHEDHLSKYNCIYLPAFLSSDCEEFINHNIQPDWSHKSKTFNFMINKPRPHREFLMAIIEHFGLDNYSYSLPWKTVRLNRDKLAKQLQHRPLYLDILNTPIKNICQTDYKIGNEVAMEQGIRNGDYPNAKTYQDLLQKNVFEPSCVSLITEPCFYERETLYTEKTIMACYGGTFPIWVGGWKIATYARTLGFDVFDDVIDHSYEEYADPWDRAYYAIEKNIDLLRNFNRAKALIEQHQHRLQHNVDLIQSNPYLKQCIATIEAAPSPLKEALHHVLTHYRGNVLVIKKPLIDENQEPLIINRLL